jgi:hypothetical protein
MKVTHWNGRAWHRFKYRFHDVPEWVKILMRRHWLADGRWRGE